jgi:hypothetical protein
MAAGEWGREIAGLSLRSPDRHHHPAPRVALAAAKPRFKIEHKGSWWQPEPVQERTRRDQRVPSCIAGGEVNTRA